MAILKSADGKFYEVPDKDLSSYEVPPERVKDIIGLAEGPAGPEPGDVEPYGGRRRRGGWCWRNWRNCYCWRNCY